MPDRGVIRNRDFGAQVRDFSGLLIGTITPTDIDMLIEYHGRYFIFAETKYDDMELPFGQRLALERLCDATERGNRPSILFVTSHHASADMDIDMAQTIVVEYRYRGEWRTPPESITLKDAIASFIKKQEDKAIGT
jgi:hypothetical protein